MGIEVQGRILDGGQFDPKLARNLRLLFAKGEENPNPHLHRRRAVDRRQVSPSWPATPRQPEARPPRKAQGIVRLRALLAFGFLDEVEGRGRSRAPLHHHARADLAPSTAALDCHTLTDCHGVKRATARTVEG